MTDSNDNWPTFTFHPGHPKHLHAVGVIASCHNSFERILFDLYLHHLDRRKFPRTLSESSFLAFNEQDRTVALRKVFAALERRKKVIELIDNLVAYFNWAWTVRNTILHAEPYPPAIIDFRDLNLVKRKNKRSAQVGYLSLDLETLRYLAEKIEEGRLQAAKINVHLKYRDTIPSRRSPMLARHGLEPLPQILVLPPALDLAERPHIGPGPQYQRPPSPK
jgi:hypothetical protein